MNIREICGLAPVVPVLIVEEVAHAALLAQALVTGGLKALEVTLRTLRRWCVIGFWTLWMDLAKMLQ